jgi:glycosyltransferase involved in cell wall biosynthesis
MNNPKVSVCMITYGHEKFIREAIEGVLMQECDFQVELVIANDCSPDKSDAIIQDILRNHPRASWISYIKHEKNIGMMPNFIFALKQCEGEYIALCEGDDYWTDPLKLQKQVDFLEENPDCIIHSGNAMILSDDANTNGKEIYTFDNDETLMLDDFLSINHLLTCTVMFKNIKFQFPGVFSELTFGDWFLYVILMKYSGLKAYKSKRLFSVYRKHCGGVMYSLNARDKYDKHIFQVKTIHKYLDNKSFAPKDLANLNNYFAGKFRAEIKSHLYFDAIKTFKSNFCYSNFRINFRKYLSVLKEEFKV